MHWTSYLLLSVYLYLIHILTYIYFETLFLIFFPFEKKNTEKKTATTTYNRLVTNRFLHETKSMKVYTSDGTLVNKHV